MFNKLVGISLACMLTFPGLAQQQINVSRTKVTKTPAREQKQTTPVFRHHEGRQSDKTYDLNGLSFGGEKCGTGKIHQHLMATDPEYRMAYEKGRLEARQSIANKYAGKLPGGSIKASYTVPVVFHVIHKGEAVGTGTNISAAQIQSAVDALNRDFGRTSADGGIGQGAGVNTEIQFCLATKDPSGNASTGINRVSGTGVSSYSSQGIISSNEAAVKNLSKWDKTKYVNIWVVSEIDDNNADQANFQGGTLGYAYLAQGYTSNTNDGIVILHNCTGNDPTGNKGYNLWAATELGRALVHEMGHVLNLNHTFEGNSCTESNCNNEGDYICDTPPAVQVNLWNCSTSGSGACTNQQIANYMDYTPESCQNMYTQGQKDEMQYTMSSIRTGLNGSSSTNCTAATPQAPVADFTANVTTVAVNGTVNFTDLSSNAPTSWAWDFGDGGTSTLQNPSRQYTVTGTYTVSLTATNSIGSDNETKTAYITVTQTGGGTPGTCDTIRWPLSGTPTVYGLGTGNGYLSGNNSYADKAKVDYFDNITPGSTVSEMIVGFGYAVDAGAGTVVTAKIWNNGGTGGTPGTVLASQTIPVATIQQAVANQQYALLVQFPSSVTLSGSFYAGIELSQSAGDTVALITNTDGDANPGTAWEQWSDNTWHSYADTANWGVNVSHMVHPIVCIPAATTLVADFTANVTTINVGGTVNFTDLTTNSPTTWAWTFGDGGTSTVQNPSRTYNAAGTYTVTLIASNGTETDTATKTNYIIVNQPTQTGNCDTIRWPLPGTLTMYGLGAGNGYLSGTNSYGDKTKVEYFSGISAGSTLDEMIVGVGHATASSPSAVATFKVWDNSGTAGAPGAVIGTATVPMSQVIMAVDSAWYVVLVQFPSTITLNGDFYAGVELSQTAGDTLVLITNTDGDSNPGTAWEQWSDNTWHTFADTANWGVNLSQMVHPIVCPGTSTCSITASATSTNPSCGQNNGTATASATGGSGYTYSWSNGATSSTISGLAAGTYTVTVTASGACTSTTSATLTATAGPTLTGTSTAAGCGTSTGTATVVATGGTTPYTYAWNSPITQTTASVTGLAAGTYTVTVTSAGSCTATQTFNISGGGSMTVTEDSTAAACTAACNGSASVTPASGTTPYSYTWSNNGTGSTATGLCEGTYNVTVSDANSCVVISSIEITTSTNINVATSYTAATCNQANGNATASPSGGQSPYTYAWSGGGAGATVSGLAAGTYTVTVTDNLGCTQTSSVAVPNQGGATATASPDQTICQGDSKIIFASGGTSYAWSNGATTSTQTVSPTTTTTYTVTVTDSYGCTATATTTLTVNTIPVTTVTAPSDTVCPGEPVVLTATGGTSYVWNVPNAGSGATVTVYPTQFTTYTVTAYNGTCPGNTATVSIPVILPSPFANVSANTTITYISLGGNVIFSTNNSVGSSFQWDFNGDGVIDQSSNNSGSVTHSYGAAGTYNCVLHAVLGSCEATDTVQIVVQNQPPTSVSESAALSMVNLFPNPTEGDITVQVMTPAGQKLDVVVMNSLGKMVYQTVINTNANSVVTLPMAGQATGVYLLRVTYDSSISTYRIVKID